jgi:hypothetical protein
MNYKQMSKYFEFLLIARIYAALPTLKTFLPLAAAINNETHR